MVCDQKGNCRDQRAGRDISGGGSVSVDAGSRYGVMM